MNQNKVKKILKKVAKKHNVPLEVVQKEIQKAIDLAKRSQDSGVQKAWGQTPFGEDKKTTPEQLIIYLYEKVKQL